MFACYLQSYVSKTNRFYSVKKRCVHFFYFYLLYFLFPLVSRCFVLFLIYLSLAFCYILFYTGRYIFLRSLFSLFKCIVFIVQASSARMTRLLQANKSEHKMSQPPVDTWSFCFICMTLTHSLSCKLSEWVSQSVKVQLPRIQVFVKE